MTDPPTPPSFFDDTHHPFSRDTAQRITKLHKNQIHNSTIPLPIETYPEDIHTIALIRGHQD